MTDPDRPLFDDAKQQLARLAASLEQMVALRWQLARLELDAALGSVKRLGVVLAIAAVMALTGLPVLVVWAAVLLPETMRAGCLLLVGLVLLVGGILVGWRAWRRFRREFVGLEETLEELREDLVWLREWTGQSDDEEGTAARD